MSNKHRFGIRNRFIFVESDIFIFYFQPISIKFSYFDLIFSECPSNYFLNNGHCYGFVDQSLSWYNARDQCKQTGEGYDLVTIEDNEENQFLKDKISSDFNGNEFWVGAKEDDDGNRLQNQETSTY